MTWPARSGCALGKTLHQVNDSQLDLLKVTIPIGCLERVHLQDPSSPASCFFLRAQDSRPTLVLASYEVRILNRCLFAWDPVGVVLAYSSSLLSQNPGRMLVLTCMPRQDLDDIGGLTCIPTEDLGTFVVFAYLLTSFAVSFCSQYV